MKATCSECGFYGLDPEEARVEEARGEQNYEPIADLTVKGKCFCSPPYPNCSRSGRIQRPVVFAKDLACRYFESRK